MVKFSNPISGPDGYILYFDCFEAAHCKLSSNLLLLVISRVDFDRLLVVPDGLSTSKDLENWTIVQDCAAGDDWKGYVDGVNFPPGVRHGSFVEISSEELAGLIAIWHNSL